MIAEVDVNIMHFSISETDCNFTWYHSQRSTVLGYHFVSLSQAWTGVTTQCKIEVFSETYKFLDTYILNRRKIGLNIRPALQGLVSMPWQKNGAFLAAEQGQ